MADPGFPVGGAPTPDVAVVTKESGPLEGVRASGAPWIQLRIAYPCRVALQGQLRMIFYAELPL